MLQEKKGSCVTDFSLICSCSRAQRDLFWTADKQCLHLIIILSIIHSLDAKAKEHRCMSCTVDQGCRCSHSSRKVKQWSPWECSSWLTPHRRTGILTYRKWALCTDGQWVKRNPILNSVQNVSFYVTRTDTPACVSSAMTQAGSGFQIL